MENKPFYIDEVRNSIKELQTKQKSFSKFVEELNEKAAAHFILDGDGELNRVQAYEAQIYLIAEGAELWEREYDLARAIVSLLVDLNDLREQADVKHTADYKEISEKTLLAAKEFLKNRQHF